MRVLRGLWEPHTQFTRANRREKSGKVGSEPPRSTHSPHPAGDGVLQKYPAPAGKRGGAFRQQEPGNRANGAGFKENEMTVDKVNVVAFEEERKPTDEPPEGQAVLPWLARQANRDREVLVSAATKLRQAHAELMTVIGRRLTFWGRVLEEAPTRRVAPRSRHKVPVGVAAGFATERIATLTEIEDAAEGCADQLDLSDLDEVTP
jgi:hypothetical protein